MIPASGHDGSLLVYCKLKTDFERGVSEWKRWQETESEGHMSEWRVQEIESEGHVRWRSWQVTRFVGGGAEDRSADRRAGPTGASATVG